MDTLLRLVGAVALVVGLALALPIGALALVLWRAKRKMRRLARLMGGPVAPVAIELVPLEVPLPPALERSARELERFGFRRVGDHRILGIPGTAMVGLTNEAEDVYAVAASHPLQGPHVDLHQSAPDGRTLTVTNAKEAAKRPSQVPWRTVVRRPGAPVATLLDEWRVARLTGEVCPTPPERMVAEFEREYRLAMEYEYTEGRFRDIDLARLSKMVGMETDPRTAAFIREARHRRADWPETLRNAFLASRRVDAAAWEAMRDEVVFVHDGLDDEALAALLLRIGGATVSDDFLPAEIDEAGGATPRERFRNGVARMGLAGRTELLASPESPEPFDVYRIAGA